MKRYCQNQYCENEAVKEVPVSVDKASDRTRAVCAVCEEAYSWGVQHGRASVKGLVVDPPPREAGDEPLFRVVCIIDVNAAGLREAAEYTHLIMTDPDSLSPVLHVIDGNGRDVVIDLSAEGSGEKIASRPDTPDAEARGFVTGAATQCPKCGSQDLSFESIDIDGQSAYQKAFCQDCDARFYSIYRLVGFGLYVDNTTEIHTVAEDFGEINE